MKIPKLNFDILELDLPKYFPIRNACETQTLKAYNFCFIHFDLKNQTGLIEKITKYTSQFFL